MCKMDWHAISTQLITNSSFTDRIRRDCGINAGVSSFYGNIEIPLNKTTDNKSWYCSIHHWRDTFYPICLGVDFRDTTDVDIFKELGDLHIEGPVGYELIRIPIEILFLLSKKKIRIIDGRYYIPINTEWLMKELHPMHLCYNSIQWIISPSIMSNISNISFVNSYKCLEYRPDFVNELYVQFHQFNRYIFDSLLHTNTHSLRIDGHNFAKGYIINYNITQIKNIQIVCNNHILHSHNVELGIELGLLHQLGPNYLYIPINPHVQLTDNTNECITSGLNQAHIDVIEIRVELFSPSTVPIIIYDVCINMLKVKYGLCEVVYKPPAPPKKEQLPTSPLALLIKDVLNETVNNSLV